MCVVQLGGLANLFQTEKFVVEVRLELLPLFPLLRRSCLLLSYVVLHTSIIMRDLPFALGHRFTHVNRSTTSEYRLGGVTVHVPAHERQEIANGEIATEEIFLLNEVLEFRVEFTAPRNAW